MADYDLAIQIVAPSVYMDSLKMGTLLHKTASLLQHPLWLLWDDTALASLIFSSHLERILADAIQVDLSDTIDFSGTKLLLWDPYIPLLFKGLSKSTLLIPMV